MRNERFYLVTKRIFDVVISIVVLILLLPLFLLVAVAIKMDTAGPVFYVQKRAGKDRREFGMFKFRTMATGSDLKGLLTIGIDDKRITRSGQFLRRYKLDELPQLINVVAGNMSLVGPRPEVMRYVNFYTPQQLQVLNVKPGITDPVSIRFFDENQIIAKYADPEEGYVKEVMPEKLRMNLEYLKNRSFFSDLKIIWKTIARIFS